MCRLCGERDCVNGALCHLGEYVSQTRVQNAIRRVQGYEPGYTARSFGAAFYYLTSGGNRPAAVSGVWAHFRTLGEAGYTCPYCQRPLRGGYHVDHVVPWEAYIRSVLGLGADDEGAIPLFVARALASDPANLHLVCASCNESKGDMEEDDPRFPAWLIQRRDWGARQMAAQAPRQPAPLPQAQAAPMPQWRQDRLRRHQERERRLWGA